MRIRWKFTSFVEHGRTRADSHEKTRPPFVSCDCVSRKLIFEIFPFSARRKEQLTSGARGKMILGKFFLPFSSPHSCTRFSPFISIVSLSITQRVLTADDDVCVNVGCAGRVGKLGRWGWWSSARFSAGGKFIFLFSMFSRFFYFFLLNISLDTFFLYIRALESLSIQTRGAEWRKKFEFVAAILF